jgi:uncharacterized protein
VTNRLADQLSEDLKGAMRAGDAVRRDEIRGLLAALQAERQNKLTRALDKQGLILRDESASLTPEQQAQVTRLRAESDLSDDEAQAVLQTRVKQHRQSIEGFQRGKRQDLVSTEEAQLAVLERYLPQQLGEAEVEAAIRDAIAASGAQGPREQGKVMGLLSSQLRGRADMKTVSARVQALLAGGA